MDGSWLGVLQIRYQRQYTCEELGSGEDGEDRKISTYNDNNMLLTEESFIKDDSDEWIPEEKTIFSWDEVIKDYFTSRMGYNWEADNSA